MLQRAQLLAGAGDAAGAERALLDALSANPKSEPVYAALLQLYDDDRLGPSLPDYPQNFERLRRRIFQEIPDSRVARLTAAEYLMLSGELDQARRVLADLLESSEGDRAAQLLLLELLEKQNDTAAAGALVEEMLAARPRDAATLVAARDFYRGPGGPQATPRDPDNFVAVLKRLRDLQEPGFARTWSTASIRLIEEDFPAPPTPRSKPCPRPPARRSGRPSRLLVQATREMDPADAEPLLLKAAGIAPAFSDQLAFALADAYDDAGRSEEAEAALIAALEASPNNAQLNNAVGYRWAYRGIQLEEAERLIGRAVAAETDSAAYLDSMGWVLYQQNRFDEALGWLNQSRARPDGANPVILLHLGDTLHRLGRTAEAEPVWAEALQAAAGIDPSLDPELEGIGERLRVPPRRRRGRRPRPRRPHRHRARRARRRRARGGAGRRERRSTAAGRRSGPRRRRAGGGRRARPRSPRGRRRGARAPHRAHARARRLNPRTVGPNAPFRPRSAADCQRTEQNSCRSIAPLPCRRYDRRLCARNGGCARSDAAVVVVQILPISLEKPMTSFSTLTRVAAFGTAALAASPALAQVDFFFTDDDDDLLRQGAAGTVISNLPAGNPRDVDAAGDVLFYTDFTTDKIYSVPVSGGAPNEILDAASTLGGNPTLFSIAPNAAGSTIYFGDALTDKSTDAPGGAITRVDRSFDDLRSPERRGVQPARLRHR